VHANDRPDRDETLDAIVGEAAPPQLSSRDQPELTLGSSMDHLEDVHLPRFPGKALIVASGADM
jgi:hypothetical protein